MYIQDVDSIFDIQWTKNLKYGDVFLQNEIEQTSRDIREEKDEHWRRVGSLQDGRNGMVLFVYERHDNHRGDGVRAHP